MSTVTPIVTRYELCKLREVVYLFIRKRYCHLKRDEVLRLVDAYVTSVEPLRVNLYRKTTTGKGEEPRWVKIPNPYIGWL